MKFFIDTANLDQIKEAQDLGILDGVTTNPSFDGKRGHNREKVIFSSIIKIYVKLLMEMFLQRLLQLILKIWLKKVRN